METVKKLPLQTKAKTKSQPNYTRGEEIFNVITHGVGVPLGILVLIFGLVKSGIVGATYGVFASLVYGICMIITYGTSAVYHSLTPSKAKRVLRTIDHCTVYLLIMGTYTGLVLTSVIHESFVAGVVILAIEWGVGALAITLTAINMKKFEIFSMICYVALGWCIVAIPHIVIPAMGLGGFLWLLGGGVAYTIGSILYGIGKRKKYMHSVFHIFCIIGSVMQFVCFIMFCL